MVQIVTFSYRQYFLVWFPVLSVFCTCYINLLDSFMRPHRNVGYPLESAWVKLVSRNYSPPTPVSGLWWWSLVFAAQALVLRSLHSDFSLIGSLFPRLENHKEIFPKGRTSQGRPCPGGSTRTGEQLGRARGGFLIPSSQH